MGRISVLSPEIRGKIAAGEVVTRPNSVIKELMENALDAQASRIEVEIEDGGKRKCLVNDDGTGMSREDALLSIERYATSKILNLDDIERIKTYGFRGEALASIAQVSYFELETADDGLGTRLEVVGGELKNVNESHRGRGTRVKVTDLFFNLPARLKFLKSSEWERRLIIDTVRTYSLVHPEVSINLSESNKTMFSQPMVKSLETRLEMLLGEVSENLVKIEVDVGSLKITGYVSRPDFQGKHNLNHIYVNNRPVRYPRIYRTVIETYQNPKNPPVFLLFINADPELVDVNIHPTKSEVKFKDERYVADVLSQTIKKKVFVQYQAPEPTTDNALNQSATGFIQETIIPYESTGGKPSIASMRESVEFWQLHNTYILTQTRSGMIIVDQHVAHERVIYDSIINRKASSQRLLFPITIELTADEYEIYLKTRDLMKDLGVEFKEFSDRTLVIDSLPTDARISREDLTGFFSEIGSLGSLMKEKFEVAKIIACKSAIKAGQKLSPVEMQSLLDRLFACENPYTCPHGRPIVLKFSLDDLAKKFGR